MDIESRSFVSHSDTRVIYRMTSLEFFLRTAAQFLLTQDHHDNRIDDFESTYHSTCIRVQYCDQDVHLNEGCSFRLEFNPAQVFHHSHPVIFPSLRKFNSIISQNLFSRRTLSRTLFSSPHGASDTTRICRNLPLLFRVQLERHGGWQTTASGCKLDSRCQ